LLQNQRVVLFFFSGTGNTEYVANVMAAALPKTTVHSIESITTEQADVLIAERDLIGFGYPIYGSDLPQPMKDFLHALSPRSGKPTFLFCTQWMFSGDGARAATRYLSHTGFNIKWAEHFFMPNNICVSFTRIFPYTNDPQRIQPVLLKTTKRAQNFACHILSGKPSRRGFNPFAHIAGSMQRVPFRTTFHRWRNDIGIDLEKCTHCLKCVNDCPAKNLAYDEKTKRFITQNTCYICLRCYDFCPVSAVTYMGHSHDPRRGKPYKGPYGQST
jgi:flavodoxin/ferredoxin